MEIVEDPADKYKNIPEKDDHKKPPVRRKPISPPSPPRKAPISTKSSVYEPKVHMKERWM